jgi:DNA polymerase-3 subunit delta'
MSQSSIIIAQDIDFARDEVLKGLKSTLVKEYIQDDFKIDDAKAVLSEAYIAEESQKTLLICASSYRIEAQNALLKLLEEPPRNIVFILIVSSKNGLLPTIRSRLPIRKIESKKKRISLDIDLAKMELSNIFTFLKDHKNIKKIELKALVETLLIDCVHKYKIELDESELRSFEKAMVLADLNTRSTTILSELMLLIYQARGRR